jgi:hypothetical protein
MSTTIEAPSAATSADVASKGSSNLTQGQAAAQLFAASIEADKKPAKAPDPATEQIAEDDESETTDAPVAEATETSVETESDESANAVSDEDSSALTEAEDEEETADVHSHSQVKFTPEQQKAFNSRLGKEIEKRRVLEERLAALESKATSKPAADDKPIEQAPPPTPLAGQSPLREYNDISALTQLQKTAKDAIRECEDRLEDPKAWRTKVDTDPDTGDEIELRVTKLGDKTYTEEQIRGIRRQAKLTLEDHIPARAAFLQAKTQAQTVAHKKFPFLKDKQAPEYQLAQQMLRDPWIQDNPNAEWIVGVQIRGLKALQSEEQAAAKGTEKPKAKPVVKPSTDQIAVPASNGSARGPADAGARKSLAAEEARMRQKGGITTAEAAASLERRERIRNSR